MPCKEEEDEVNAEKPDARVLATASLGVGTACHSDTQTMKSREPMSEATATCREAEPVDELRPHRGLGERLRAANVGAFRLA